MSFTKVLWTKQNSTTMKLLSQIFKHFVISNLNIPTVDNTVINSSFAAVWRAFYF